MLYVHDRVANYLVQRRLPIEDNDVIVAHVSLDNVPIFKVVIGIARVVPQIDALAIGADDVARAGVDLGSVGHKFTHLVNVVPSHAERSRVATVHVGVSRGYNEKKPVLQPPRL